MFPPDSPESNYRMVNWRFSQKFRYPRPIFSAFAPRKGRQLRLRRNTNTAFAISSTCNPASSRVSISSCLDWVPTATPHRCFPTLPA